MPHSRSPFAPEPAAAAPSVALVVEGIDWHARTLAQAFAALGVRTQAIRLQSCAVDTRRACGLVIEGFGDRLPDAVLVREMSGGTFQAVTLRLGILHALRENGVLRGDSKFYVSVAHDEQDIAFTLNAFDVAAKAVAASAA